jgi:hypothetical protein
VKIAQKTEQKQLKLFCKKITEKNGIGPWPDAAHGLLLRAGRAVRQVNAAPLLRPGQRHGPWPACQRRSLRAVGLDPTVARRKRWVKTVTSWSTENPRLICPDTFSVPHSLAARGRRRGERRRPAASSGERRCPTATSPPSFLSATSALLFLSTICKDNEQRRMAAGGLCRARAGDAPRQWTTAQTLPPKGSFPFRPWWGKPLHCPCSSTDASACRCASDREERRGRRRWRSFTGDPVSSFFAVSPLFFLDSGIWCLGMN